MNKGYAYLIFRIVTKRPLVRVVVGQLPPPPNHHPPEYTITSIDQKPQYDIQITH